jgi:hypothetical protein
MSLMSKLEKAVCLAVDENGLAEIPRKIPSDFKPTALVHAILMIDWNTISPGNSSELRFQVGKPDPVTQPPPASYALADMKKYAQSVADAQGLVGNVIDPSPYDIPVDQQCWILIELRSDLKNWHFVPDGYGCTTKVKPKGKARNCALHHVYKGQPMGDPGEVVRDDLCGVLFFGVVRRGGKGSTDPDNPSADAFNIHVEFKQTDKDPTTKKDITKRLKVIFDPDVKNDGAKFPP